MCIRNLAHQGQIIHELTLTTLPAKHSIVCQVFAYTARYQQWRAAQTLTLASSMMKIPILFSFLILILFSCQNNFKEDEIVLGMYCGECKGMCFQGYIIKDDSVYKFSAKSNTQLENMTKRLVSQMEANKIKNLISRLPSNMSAYPKTIGCPDCRDQCGILLQTSIDGKTRTFFIDPDVNKQPKELQDFVSRVKELNLL